jgi:murein DD-endopeptidase MepM/ murein hydrolase activator NlpD
MRLLPPDLRGWSAPPRRLSNRRRFSLALLLPLLAGLVLVAPVGPAAGDDLSDAIARQKRLEVQLKVQRAQVDELNRQQAALKAGIAATAASLTSVNADLTAVEAQVHATVDQVSLVRGRIHGLTAQVSELDIELATVQVREDVKAAELKVRKDLLAERIRNAYDTDRTPMLEALLSSESFTDVLTEVSYHLDVAAEDKALADQIVADQETLAAIHGTVVATRDQADTLRSEAAAEKVELDARMAELQAAQAALQKLREETNRLLAEQQTQYTTLARQEVHLQDLIAANEKADKQLDTEIERLARLQAQQGAIPSEYSGSLSWPLRGTVTQEFGCTGFRLEPPLGDCRHFHTGIDIAAPMYTPVRAAGDGVVLVAGPNPYDRSSRRAWIVIIAHSSRLVTWYVHLDNRAHPPAVRVGDHVSAGQVIGYVGLTGLTTGPHLHWAVKLDGVAVNPRLFL